MKIKEVEITLVDLQNALRDYCEKHLNAEPDVVTIVSHNAKISAQLADGGLIHSEAFMHRAQDLRVEHI